MFRVINIATLSLLTALAASAGSIQIGGSNGLTQNYILQGPGAVCAAGPGNCITGSVGEWVEKNYDNALFKSATNGTAPVPFAGYVQEGGEPSGLTATSAADGTLAGGLTFSMIGGDMISNGASANFWESGSGDNSITIPIGVYDVTSAALMLQDLWGSVGGNNTDVTFYFGNQSNATSGLTPVTFALTNSNNSTSGAAGQIRTGIACTVVTTATCNAATDPESAPLAASTVSTNDGTYTVATAPVFGASTTVGGQYEYTSLGGGFYADTEGYLNLDDQDFIFGNTFANDWLVGISVEDIGGGTNVNGTALTAITIDPGDPTPEPATVLLFMTGLGGFAAMRLRRRKLQR